jgi:hypothetical protein
MNTCGFLFEYAGDVLKLNTWWIQKKKKKVSKSTYAKTSREERK